MFTMTRSNELEVKTLQNVAVRADNPRRRRWGFTTGTCLAAAGLLLGAVTAARYAMHAGLQLPAEPPLTIALRLSAGAMLVVTGFTLMVLSVRGVDAEDPAPDRNAEVAASIAGDDLLCRRCGAANDYLARFCDQCGKRL